MAYVNRNVEVEVNVDLDDFSDEELSDEIVSRGFTVIKCGDLSPVEIELRDEIIWRFKNGYIEDAVILLERMIPELRGLSEHIRK